MQIILVDGKAWERHRSAFADFIYRIERLIGNPPETDEWLDNDAVCRRLSISPRTLQTLSEIRAKSPSPWSGISVITKPATSLIY